MNIRQCLLPSISCNQTLLFEDVSQSSKISVVFMSVIFLFRAYDIVGDWRQWCRDSTVGSDLLEPNGVGRDRKAAKYRFSGRCPGFSCGSHTPNRLLGHRDGARGFHADTPQTAERPSGQSGRISSCSLSASCAWPSSWPSAALPAR